MKWNAIRVLATLALAAAPGFASPIFVANFSFEDPTFGAPTVCASGAPCSIYFGAIPSWNDPSAVTTFGRLQPGTDGTKFSSSTPSVGITQAFAVSGTISQVVVPTVVAGWLYTLRVDIGNRFDRPFDGTVDLLINSNTYAATGSTPADGTFNTWTATYLGTALDAGKSITIELKASGDQGNFDNVRLDAVPEPASFLLIGPALLVLGALRRRRPNV
jgi:hypothetical protein